MDEAAEEIPSIVLSGEVLELDRESEEWKVVAKKVREACETWGCFVVEYDKIPIELQEELFETTKDMFDLPEETKLKYKKATPKDGGYVVSNPFIPLYESFGVYGEDEVRAFEKLMWPRGKPGFCEVQISVTAKMLELNLLLLRMIFESFGVGDFYDSKAMDDSIVGRLRAHKYKLPKENQDPIGLKPHVDKTILTILCQNSVQGLEVLTKQGNWIPINIPRGAMVVIVGDALEAWTNGRLHPPKHRVVMSGNKVRYSCGFFAIPKDGVTIEAPPELVDNDYPLRYRPFVYSEYLAKHIANVSFDALKIYAGV
ncbi:probable 2-oxoglutarate-dependent dioxygenase AOP1 [Actinidia eriantha]|uniref:probable 2-oxoglutarate-dependent dioxygenase AOP1 n=1 Tax=Actinidia eriantha TaxID=165200 RepID=UPI00258C60AF|nr:probable 2-oxoglutarate-dependent dioxygenase AOP1 [Actinidia eriantha]